MTDSAQDAMPGATLQPLPMTALPRSLFDALCSDADFLRLDARPIAFDPLAALGWSHRERAHTRALAWMLGAPNDDLAQQHAHGPTLLRALTALCLQRIDALPGALWPVPPAAPGAVRPETVTVETERAVGDGVRTAARAPDVCCTFDDDAGHGWLVVVEAKVEADEGTGQVGAYLDWMAHAHPTRHRVLAYVTPDGRAPEARPEAPCPVVCLRWGELAAALLASLPQGETAATAFLRSVLHAWCARYGGDATAATLVAAVWARHGLALGRLLGPGTTTRGAEAVTRGFPKALWHLRHHRPAPAVWTRRWAEAVARAVSPTVGQLVATAPHAALPDEAAWAVAGVTEALSVTVRCTPGRALGVLRPRLWLSLYAPRGDARSAFAAREQLAALARLPEPARRALLEAHPTGARAAPSTSLCVGDPVVAPEGIDFDDSVARTAAALTALLRPFTEAWARLANDPAMRLYADDLDPLRVFPAEVRDREALAEEAASDATRVWIVAETPTGHPAELRRAAALGRALTRHLGGSGRFVYDLVPGQGATPHSDRPAAVVLDLTALRATGNRLGAHAEALIANARAQGAALWVLAEAPHADLGTPHNPGLRTALAPLLHPLALETSHTWHDPVGPVRAWITTAARAPAVCPAVCAAWWQSMRAP